MCSHAPQACALKTDVSPHTEQFLQVNGIKLQNLALGRGSEATRLATLYVVYLDAALDSASGGAVMKESPIPNPQPAPGTPYAQVLQWWTSYSPDFSTVRCPTLAIYAIQDRPPLPPTAPEDLRRRADVYWQTKWLPTVKQ